MIPLIFIALFLWTQNALADSSSLNLQLPSTGGNYSSDTFKSGEMNCSNAIDGSTKFEFGVTGLIDNYSSPFRGGSGDSTKDVGVYARITIPLDGPAERINCNTLYQLELQRRRIDVQKLQQELNNLRRLQQIGFDN